jgi:hypothetical protein
MIILDYDFRKDVVLRKASVSNLGEIDEHLLEAAIWLGATDVG